MIPSTEHITDAVNKISTNDHVRHTASGLILTLLGAWGKDILHTIVLAIIGASISFFTPIVWKWLLGIRKRKKSNRPFKKS